MPTLDESFRALVSALTERYGPPTVAERASDPFRAILETVLSRSVDARKVAKALDRLGDESLIDARGLATADVAEVRDHLRECGIGSPAKAAATIQRLAHWLADHHDGPAGSADDLQATSTEQLRDELLSLNGVGPAMADALLLVALQRAVYPVDRATYRILVRHGWVDPWAGYDEARGAIEAPCAGDPAILESLSTWMERLGREYCKASIARCERCPLQPFLPESGPVQVDGA